MSKEYTIAVNGGFADQIGTAGLNRLCQTAANMTLADTVTLTVAGPTEHHVDRVIRRTPQPKPAEVDTAEAVRDIQTHVRAIAKLAAELAP